MRIDLGIFKKRLDLIVIILAGLYFAYQVSNGSDVSNMSIGISTERSDSDSLYDHLTIELNLINGDNGSIILHEIKTKISSIDSSVDTIINEFIGTVELEEMDTKNGKRLNKEWELQECGEYRFAVNETIQYATYLKVPKGKVYKIEIAIMAERNRFWIPDYRQWKASSISLPKTEVINTANKK